MIVYYWEFDPYVYGTDENRELQPIHTKDRGCGCCSSTDEYYTKEDKLKILDEMKTALKEKIAEIESAIVAVTTTQAADHVTRDDYLAD